MLSPDRAVLVIVGAGPRGVSLLERIGASAAEFEGVGELVVHLIDDTEIGAGRVWRTDQTRELCMNTLAAAVTLFTDEASTVAGPVRPGPNLYEWCLLVRDGGDSPDVAESFRAELADLRPESHPSRALYGEYIRWCLAHALASLPPTITVVPHLARVVGIREQDGADAVILGDGTTLIADAVIAATGWMPRGDTAEEQRLLRATAADPALIWVRPDNPVEQQLDRIPDRAPVIVRGLGMGFFDAMALLTIGRGGRFIADVDAPGGLRYDASGREPVLHVTSHRGLPYRAKSLYGSLPPASPQRLLRAVDWATVPRPIDFDRRIWPLVIKDAFLAYYETLHRIRPDAVTVTWEQAQRTITEAAVPPDGPLDAVVRAVQQVADLVVADPDDRFPLAELLFPAPRVFPTPDAFDAWVREFVASDLAEAERGADSPLKAGLWSLGSARQPTSLIGSFGGFDAESRASGFRLLHAFGGTVGSGPPAFRNRQLLALIEAGLVRFLGPAATVAVEDGAFQAGSPTVRGSKVTAKALLDAWMHFHDVDDSADPLTRSLTDAGRARAFRIPTREGGTAATGGFDVDPASGRLIHRDGSIDARVHIAGIPIDETMHDAIISPMPRTDPTMLRETDRVARSALDVLQCARRNSPRRIPA
ncbi:hypothetical protein QF046_000138 [Microbacterium sp. W4I4]|uniref:FAD/NAD(P)-binding protein n=1 Tax=Microbacterium sp. W4I4 TaxID=3042295 RepID=UPI00277F1D09|nr:FAD/NAD(P)-binding protein [Microbacterium sp. W4I4]MDQ0612497.1 hypothetical protein [Microbacterium sp. W4I4]